MTIRSRLQHERDRIAALPRLTPAHRQKMRELDRKLVELDRADLADRQNYSNAHADGCHEGAPRQGCPDCESGRNGYPR